MAPPNVTQKMVTGGTYVNVFTMIFLARDPGVYLFTVQGPDKPYTEEVTVTGAADLRPEFKPDLTLMTKPDPAFYVKADAAYAKNPPQQPRPGDILFLAMGDHWNGFFAHTCILVTAARLGEHPTGAELEISAREAGALTFPECNSGDAPLSAGPELI
jgi:hypothetical protein